MTNKESQLWGGRFKNSPSPALKAISSSIEFDWRLARFDLLQTWVHAQTLVDANILTLDDSEKLLVCLTKLSQEVAAEEVSFLNTDEDVHTAVERLVFERLPDIASKLRTGRSRNDQVATDFRLFIRHEIRELVNLLVDLSYVISSTARLVADLPSPGYTHLQRAQPVTLGHEIAKHLHPLLRDIERLQQLDPRIAVSPLGSGALSGSSYVVDTEKVAKRLGFDCAASNSIDAVSDRDFAVEFLFIASLIGTHLSRIAEEVILWTSKEFGFANLDDAWSTGSSLMPQKKNPDIAELTRGKSGRLVGNLVSLLITLKALPFAYNRDLQEDKEPVFDSFDQLKLILPALSGLLETLSFDWERISALSGADYSLATEVADYLVRQGVPFKDAHEITGELVMFAEEQKVSFSDLTDVQLSKISPHLDPGVRVCFSADVALKSRLSISGPAFDKVIAQIDNVEKQLVIVKLWSSQNPVVLL